MRNSGRRLVLGLIGGMAASPAPAAESGELMLAELLPRHSKAVGSEAAQI